MPKKIFLDRIYRINTDASFSAFPDEKQKG